MSAIKAMACICLPISMAAASQAVHAHSPTEAGQGELAVHLSKTIGSYQDMAFWCHKGGAFSYAEYVIFRSRATATLALGVGLRDAYLLIDAREGKLAESSPSASEIASGLTAKGLTPDAWRSACVAWMTDYEYEIGVVRAKLGLMK